jgi:hypothetical protein
MKYISMSSVAAVRTFDISNNFAASGETCTAAVDGSRPSVRSKPTVGGSMVWYVGSNRMPT